jgi:drug/metabolite transporter (DMT)-like permease
MAYSSAGFTALLGWWWLREELGWGKIVAVVLSLSGCALISGAVDPIAWQLNTAGILVGIFSGLGFAFYTMMGRSASQRGLNPWSTLLYSFGFAAFFLFIFNMLPLPVVAGGTSPGLHNLFWLGGAVAGWVVLYTLAAGPSIGGYGLYNVSLGYLPSSVANLIATLEPAFTAVIAYFLLGENLSGIQLLGGGMILGGVLFLRIYENKKNA